MLHLKSTRILRSKIAAVVAGVIIADEGIALVWDKSNGEAGVRPSTGAAGEVFAGVSQVGVTVPQFLPRVEDGIVPENLTVKLVRTPIAGQLLVKQANVALEVVTGAPADNTEVQLKEGNVLVFHASSALKRVSVQYAYSPTLEEARTVLGDERIGGVPSRILSSITRLTDTEVGTNYFDASADWADVLYAKLGADGKFVPGTEADHIHGVTVLNTPNAGNPFLVLAISVA